MNVGLQAFFGAKFFWKFFLCVAVFKALWYYAVRIHICILFIATKNIVCCVQIEKILFKKNIMLHSTSNGLVFLELPHNCTFSKLWREGNFFICRNFCFYCIFIAKHFDIKKRGYFSKCFLVLPISQYSTRVSNRVPNICLKILSFHIKWHIWQEITFT